MTRSTLAINPALMLPTIILFYLFIGIAAGLPAPAGKRGEWFGFRFFQAAMALIFVLYVGNVLLGISLSVLAILLGGAATFSVVAALYRARKNLGQITLTLTHPVWIFAILVGIVTATRGGLEYLPYPGDEVASWLRLTRQIFLVDAYWSDIVTYHHGAYTNGWPLLMAFANTLGGGAWDDGHAALVPFLLHLGLLGFQFDFLKNKARDVFGCAADADLFAWVGVLGLLTIEASWILVPRFLLVDEPLTYVIIGAFLTAMLGLNANAKPGRVAAFLGLTLASGYLIKIAILAILPALAVMVAGIVYCMQARVRTLVIYASWLLLPVGAAALSWALLKTGAECNASPLRLLSEEGVPSIERLRFVNNLYFAAFMDYVPFYKTVATIASIGCLATGLLHRRLRWVVLAVGVFICGYSAALYISYVSCLDIIENVELQSFQRYFLVNLRVLHVLGPIVMALWVLDHVKIGPLTRKILAVRGSRFAIGMTIIAGLSYQAWMIERSIDDFATRNLQDPYIRDSIVQMKRESGSLRSLIAQLRLENPRISLIAQGGYGVEADLGGYFGIRERPDPKTNFVYTIVHPYSWAESKFNFATAITNQKALTAWWRDFDIIWPVKIDAYAQAAIADLVDDRECREYPIKYFIVRMPMGNFVCFSKFE